MITSFSPVGESALLSTAPDATVMKHDHGFHPLTIAEVIRETDDARSFVFDVPAELRDAYRYQAGQFCTFRFDVGGEVLLRCYSMSSSPDVDSALTTTVKRVPNGRVSNFMIDRLRAGDVVDATLPTGVFCLTDDDAPVCAFGGGSGITPVISIIKSVLTTTERPVRLFYANRDNDSIIFAEELRRLAAAYDGRFTLANHVDVDCGYAEPADIEAFIEARTDSQFYVCGPTPFMDLVEKTLEALEVSPERVHSERFVAPVTPRPTAPAPAPSGIVTITLAGRTEQLAQTPAETLLDSARRAGLSPPFSCELGNCATCMAKLVQGTVEMRNNSVLEPDEIDDGWVLTCQSVPTSDRVAVVYED